MFEIKGLDKLMRELEQFSKAMGELDGDICEVRFNPDDPASIEQAISEMEAAIDERAAPYHGNDLVTSTVEEMKEQYRQAILEKAAESRLAGEKTEEE
jgi:hypothetical protein